ncbi:AAA family ATPase [Planctomicrobium sp. SH661]|uniref:ExeA family protein n=1 Tax=Planctomicrobium sp. SH661 TaxID=3448124 RepID=UPI003F5B7772
MYEEFFGFEQRPFSTTPSGEDFVGIAPFQDALDSLVHCVTQARGIAVITSAPGLGKTMLCRRLAKLLQQNVRSIYLSAAGMESRLGLLQGILFELNMGYVGLTDQEARLKIYQAARDAKADHRGFLLIVDEAHLLSHRLLEEVRTLTEYAPDGENLIQVVLCGSFELEETLADPALTSFNQRIGLQICLNPLSLNDSARFISERFKTCGQPDVFSVIDEDALELICRASDGNLRCLTQLVDHACLLAFADAVQPIDRQHVRSALDSLKELPLRWNDVPGELAAEPVNDSWVDPLEEIELNQDESMILPRPRRISPTEQETDEFPIPEFLRLDDGSIASAHDALEVGAGEHETPTLPLELSQPVSESPPADYAVFEFGAGLDTEETQTHAATTSTVEEPQAIQSPIEILEFPQPVINPPAYAPSLCGPEMIETPVIDRYTLLDRIYELPEERRSEIDLSSLDVPQESFDRASSAVDTPSTPVSIPEEDVLELVQQIRREVREQILPQQTAGATLPGPHHQLPQIDLPVSEQPEERAEESTPAESAPPRRFEQLFTRLRLRRRKLESDQQSR